MRAADIRNAAVKGGFDLDKFDLIVIGAGPGGYMAALEAAKYGMKTALVEKAQLGGTCLNRGCIPTKTLMHSTDLYRQLKSAADLGIETGPAAYCLEKIYGRKDAVVAQLRDGIAALMKKNKVTVFTGLGQVTGEHRVTVISGEAVQHLEGDHILIATGSEPAVPPIPGADLPGVLTSDALLDTEHAPALAGGKRLVVIGGGVIGLEFASVFNALDHTVTVIEALDRILANMDREISQNTKMIYKKRGIDFHTGARVDKITAAGDGSLICHYTEKDQPMEVCADHILVAVGRRPYVDGLFGPEFTLAKDKGRLQVNEYYQTECPSIYAIGDVIGGIQLAHGATAEGISAVEHMAARRGHGGVVPRDFKVSYNMAVVPSCVYTDPEIASVGMTSDEAKHAGLDVIVKKYPMSANGKSVLSGQERGFMKLVARSDTHELIGAQLMGGRATDIIGEAATAIVNHLTLEDMKAVIHPHPTFCEGMGEVLRS